MLWFIRYLTNNFVVLPIVWLAYKLNFFVFKRSLKLQLLLNIELRLRIRYLEPKARLEGYDEKFDLMVTLVTLKLLDPEIFDDSPPEFLYEEWPTDLRDLYSERKSEYLKHKKEIDNLIEKLEQDEQVAKIRLYYPLVRHFSAERLEKKSQAKYYMRKARDLNPEVSTLTTNDLFTLEGGVRREINRLRSKVADRQAIKIPLSTEKAGALISLVSCFFLVTGYLYNRLFWGHFGIEVSKYFTLSDYLAASIEGVRYSAIGAFVGLVAYFIGAYQASRKSYAQLEHERKKRDYLPWLAIGIAAVSMVKGYMVDPEMFYEYGYILVIIIGLYLAPWLSNKFFKEPLAALFVLVFIISYSANMIASVGGAIHHAMNYPFDQIRTYDFEFKKELSINESDLAFITGNSNYLFFLDRGRKAVVVPKDQILYFRKRKIEETDEKS
jgi:hypothetical protein